MSKNVLYFWCFELERDDTKAWCERHRFGQTIAVISLLIVGIPCFLILGGFILGFAGILSKYVTNIDLCKSDASVFQCSMMYIAYGGICILVYVFSLLQTITLFLPIFIPIYLYTYSHKSLVDYMKHCKLYFIIASIFISLFSVYSISLLGAIFYADKWCGFDNYDKFMNCWFNGQIVFWIIFAIYVGICMLLGIPYNLYLCIKETGEVMDKHEREPLITTV